MVTARGCTRCVDQARLRSATHGDGQYARGEDALSRLVEAVESGREAEVIIARDGKPAAPLVPMPKGKPIRLGLAEGDFVVPDPDPELDAEIDRLLVAQARAEPMHLLPHDAMLRG